MRRNGKERRSLRSRTFRFFAKPSVHLTAAACVIGGWATILFAAPSVGAETANHFEFVVWMGGALFIFIGCTAGLVSWVVNPAVEKRFAQHVLRGVEEHRDLLAVAEYNARHEAIVEHLSRIEGALGIGPESSGKTKMGKPINPR